MIFSYNSRIEEYKSPFGAIASGDSIRFKLTAKDGVYVDSLVLEVKKQDEQVVVYPMPYSGKPSAELSEYSTTIHITTAGIYWYRFIAYTEVGRIVLCKGHGGNLASHSRQWFQQTVYDNSYCTPKSATGGIIYHIFIDRFNRGADASCVFDKRGTLKKWSDEITIVDKDGVFRANDFYGGNFQGVIDKLSYFVGLGVTILYLSPIFKSSSNHRYDTGDYMRVDELLGDEEKFKELIAKAKQMGIGIILDGVFNHTGADSLYFNKFSHYDSVGAYQGIKSPYFDWYTFINYPNEYACWWGITVTPTINKAIQSYRQFIYGKNGVVDKWTKMGLAGWRLDVVDELETDFLSELCNSIKANGNDKVIIGEVWEDASTKVAYGTMRPYLLGKQLDGVMNYPFKNAIFEYCINSNKDFFTEIVMSICENYPVQSLNCSMTLVGTHDTVRVINRLSGINVHEGEKACRLNRRLTDGERELGKRRLMMASSLQYILPGIPSVYYGDEVGLEGFEDPINRRTFPWDNMDEEILNHYIQLGKMREKYKDVLCGEIKIIPHEKLLILTRRNKSMVLTIICNNSREVVEWQSAGYVDALTGELCGGIMSMHPHTYKIISC